MKNISFVINVSINTRDHIELLIESLRVNLHNKEHEILVFIDSDNEDICGYLKSKKSEFHDLKIITHKVKPCVGYSRNNNLLVELAKHDIVSYLQSDMVIGPNYDAHILNQLQENTILSATRVEPPLHGYSDYTITKDFGTDPTKFDMDEWNSFSINYRAKRSAEYFFAPITFYKKVWQDLGGYDTLYRRSREDSDLVQRALHAGIKLMQTWEANVYHFSCVSSRGKNWFDQENKTAQNRVELQNLADQIELKRFIRQWGKFNHGQEIIKKYDIDLVITNAEGYLGLINNIEPYFSRVWLDMQKSVDSLINFNNNQHEFANTLLGFTDQDWNFASKFYNQVDYNNIYKVGQPENYNCAIFLDVSKSHNNASFYNTLPMIHKLIANQEVGSYQLDEVILDIRNIVEVTKPIKVNNPEFDMSLLDIQ